MTSINFAAGATSKAGAETSLGVVVGVASGVFLHAPRIKTDNNVIRNIAAN